jgi:uncharacterized membrane protein
MNTENAELMKIARKSLDGKWVLAVGTFLIYLIISGAIQAFAKLVEFVGVLSLIITGPFMVGMNIFALKIYRNQEARIENLFEGFRNFVNALAAYILMLVFIILWTNCQYFLFTNLLSISR